MLGSCGQRRSTAVAAAKDAWELRAAAEHGGGSGEGCLGAAGSGGAWRRQRRSLVAVGLSAAGSVKDDSS
ncbi:Lethal(3)Malignant Brain Tumor-Like Protein 3 [Manis pentadactyla]|nr:Lethal(3)Malignant Brain Tumor-Like Protein 3 [Manis pentadactyla]